MKIALIAALTLALGTTAFAAEKIKAKALTDKQMDNVVAAGAPDPTGQGLTTASAAGASTGQASPNYPAGYGTYTASQVKP